MPEKHVTWQDVVNKDVKDSPPSVFEHMSQSNLLEEKLDDNIQSRNKQPKYNTEQLLYCQSQSRNQQLVTLTGKKQFINFQRSQVIKKKIIIKQITDFQVLENGRSFYPNFQRPSKTVAFVDSKTVS